MGRTPLPTNRRLPSTGPLTRSRTSTARSQVTYVSAWVTKFGPDAVANLMQPHRLYGFKNSNGNTVFVYNQNIRAPLSGRMGQVPAPTNAEFIRLLRRLITRVKHPRYISNMARNIVAAREAAKSKVLSRRRRRRPTRSWCYTSTGCSRAAHTSWRV